MPDKYVLDSSVIAAIFFPEPSSELVVETVQDKDLVTVDLARAEVANVAWKKVAIFSQDPQLIQEALRKSMEFINTACDVIPTQDLVEESFHIAVDEKITFYDSLFLAAALKEKVPLLTLDKKLETSSIPVRIL
jgi:predicted nucleic acid-binding protein